MTLVYLQALHSFEDLNQFLPWFFTLVHQKQDGATNPNLHMVMTRYVIFSLQSDAVVVASAAVAVIRISQDHV